MCVCCSVCFSAYNLVPNYAYRYACHSYTDSTITTTVATAVVVVVVMVIVVVGIILLATVVVVVANITAIIAMMGFRTDHSFSFYA